MSSIELDAGTTKGNTGKGDLQKDIETKSAVYEGSEGQEAHGNNE